MGEIIVKTSEEIQNVDFPTLSTYGDILNAPTSISDIDKAAAALLDSLDEAILCGTVQTTSDTAALIDIIDVTATKPIVLVAYVRAINPTTNDQGGFVVKAVFKYVAGAATIIGQIQELFTMRDQDYDVDFIKDGATVQLRVKGLSGHTVNWNYSVVSLN